MIAELEFPTVKDHLHSTSNLDWNPNWLWVLWLGAAELCAIHQWHSWPNRMAMEISASPAYKETLKYI